MQRGFCARHFTTHVLYLPDRQTGRNAKGVSRRPFKASQFPSGRLSEVQIDMMNDLERLPMATSLEECIARLNEADPSNLLESVPPRQRKK